MVVLEVSTRLLVREVQVQEPEEQASLWEQVRAPAPAQERVRAGPVR